MGSWIWPEEKNQKFKGKTEKKNENKVESTCSATCSVVPRLGHTAAQWLTELRH